MWSGCSARTHQLRDMIRHIVMSSGVLRFLGLDFFGGASLRLILRKGDNLPIFVAYPDGLKELHARIMNSPASK